MIDRLESFHQEWKHIDDEHRLFGQVASLAGALGFDYCCYGVSMQQSATQSTTRVFDTYPDGWMNHYREHGLLAVDPTVRMGRQTDELIVWHGDALPPAPQFWREAGEFGLLHGVAQSSWGAHGEYGLLSLGRTQEPISLPEVHRLELSVRVLANYTHVAMGRILRTKVPQPAIDTLSPREREVLMWTAEGKTADEIGSILGISTRTVNYHIYNALEKTGSRNKVQAAIKLLLFG
ncbi:LuxR family transcriptional regulator [Jeongeupia sp. USM3]|uniref:LuxR family transcriptional regulator n=1 Tax=Jeongeupia sp. USM3 TaxID=1906741 RepID=UPI00089E0586|nr:LuxR family transcriptional regulator [Jeongeupia sp. USM3]AOY00489.1 hypothetical protein BJP62_08580 [Jeongeupia sp. USM3]